MSADDKLEKKAATSGMPVEALIAVYRRGIGAARTNPQSVRLKKDYSKNPNMKKFPRSARLSPQQWAMARVNAFIAHKPTVFTGADDDVRRKFKL
jgi:hypothetical protein